MKVGFFSGMKEDYITIIISEIYVSFVIALIELLIYGYYHYSFVGSFVGKWV